MADGGTVGLNVVPDFTGLGSLLNSGIRPALNQLQSLGQQGGKLLGSGVGLGVAAGVAAAGIAIGEFVRSGISDFVQLGEQTRKLEQLTGASAQQASLFAGVIKDLGGNVDTVSRGLGIFSANIAKQPQLFAQYGVEIAKTKQGNIDVLGTLDNLRQSFQGSAAGAVHDAEAKQLLGKAYQQLLPYLSLTNDQLKTFQDLVKGGGHVLSPDDVEKARELKIEMQELSDHVEKLKLSAGRAGAGLLNNLLGNINDDPKRALADLGAVLTGNVSGLQDLFSSHGSAASAARRQAAAEIDAKEAMQQAGIQATAEATALKALAGAGEGIRSAQEALTSANDEVAKAGEGVTKAEQSQAAAHRNTLHAAEQLGTAQQNLADLYRKSAEGSDEVAQAQLGVESADRAVRDATEALTKATQDLAEEQQFAAVDAAHELTQAHLGLAEATLSVQEARFRAARTVPTLADPFAQRRAQLGVAQAVEAQRQAQENLSKEQQFGTQASKQLADAQTNVRNATEHLTDAFQGQDKAESQLREAQLAFDRQEIDLQRAVRDAQQGVNDAKQAEVDAHQSVVDAQDNVTKAKQRAYDATINLRDAQYSLDEQIQKAIDSGADMGRLYDELAAKYPELIPILNQLKAVAESLVAVTHGVDFLPQIAGGIAAIMAGAQPNQPIQGTAGIESILGPALNPPGRATGGDVAEGWFTVGEHGKELLHAGGSGHVYPKGGDGPAAIDYDRLGAAVAAALVAAGRPLVTVGEQVVLAQKRYGTATRGRV